MSALLTRTVIVNRNQTLQQMFDATKCYQSFDKDVDFASMPTRGAGIEKVTMEFFELGYDCCDEEIAWEFELRGLTPDPYAQIQVNIDDPTFASHHFNVIHWKDVNDKWCCVVFKILHPKHYCQPRVAAFHHKGRWSIDWWFGGVRK